MKPMIKKAFLALMLLACFGWGYAQSTNSFNVPPKLEDFINGQKQELEKLKETICKQTELLSKEVSKNADGSLEYPNWVVFVQVAEGIAALNEEWGDAYSSALNSITQKAIELGDSDVEQDEKENTDFFADFIEENYLTYPEDVASVCFESRFDFQSLRHCIDENDTKWLSEQGDADNFTPNNAPSFEEELFDEEYWPLITCDKRYTILNKEVTEQMMENVPADSTVLTTIKDIVAIFKDVVIIWEGLHKLFADCAGTTTITEKTDRDTRIKIPNNGGFIGYKILQKGVALDMVNKTATKIKGKAKLYKSKKNGGQKRDRKNNASIGFCAKEWNNCEKKDWPSDPGNYLSPHQNGGNGKKKIKHHEPKALAIEKSYHFLQFKFGKNGVFVEAINLLGNTGCVNGSNTNW